MSCKNPHGYPKELGPRPLRNPQSFLKDSWKVLQYSSIIPTVSLKVPLRSPQGPGDSGATKNTTNPKKQCHVFLRNAAVPFGNLEESWRTPRRPVKESQTELLLVSLGFWSFHFYRKCCFYTQQLFPYIPEILFREKAWRPLTSSDLLESISRYLAKSEMVFCLFDNIGRRLCVFFDYNFGQKTRGV